MPKANKNATDDELSLSDPEYFWRPLPEISEMFGLSEERCRQFVKQGVWDRREDGKLHLQVCLHMYERFLANPSWFRENFE